MLIIDEPLPTIRAIYDAYEQANDEVEREYLGASIIGDECWRKLYYTFRWIVEPEKFNGELLRLFQTGHREEERMIDDLRRIGVQVWDRDPDDPKKQIGISDIGGHFRGHLDGIGLGFKEAPKTPHVVEAKTHSTKSFRKLRDEGVRKSKPQHYAQMQTYMHYMELSRAFYIAYGKNDDALDEYRVDALYGERCEYDPVFAARLTAKARSIITADRPPPKLHADPEAKMAWACRQCHALDHCHRDLWPRFNCRTCIYSTPAMDGDARWICEKHGHDLSREAQEKGCANHLWIPDIVPGEQIDADEVAGTVTYALKDGTKWVDGKLDNSNLKFIASATREAASTR
ncbi:hypothetical protein [Methylosinus sp. PW1]|uniref:hypothetical protein n=1 Tax=Methylosinus sp. PW1 TaxID=107636 RepID=UPI000563F077|nr:hypothetical protein [Methylosinus sp. PW1]